MKGGDLKWQQRKKSQRKK